MNIIELNERIENIVNKYDLTDDALALKKEHAIDKSEAWQRVLDSYADQSRMLKIGIIGRVKAGKSSLLNALLFNGENILPKAATPMTAALTIMQYGDSVRAEVDFFSQQDIEEIQKQHTAYIEKREQLVKEKERETIAKALEKKKREIKHGKFDVVLSETKLTVAEIQECHDKAARQADSKMKNEPTFAAYDQYERICASDKTLAELEQHRNIQAASVAELLGKLDTFVGANGAYMPFTKSVTLYIPEVSLKGLQVIDTPGINDPVTSREDRTERLLQECDTVLLVSPTGQFLTKEDTSLMYRLITKEGTQEAYIIASQADNQLYGDEYAAYTDPTTVLDKITELLTNHARSVLQKQAQQYPSMTITAGKLAKENVVCTSGTAFSLLRRYNAQQTWDSDLQHVWHCLEDRFPTAFSSEKVAKSTLENIANIDKLQNIVAEVATNKTKILNKRKTDFENSKCQALQSYLQAWLQRINEQINRIETTDIVALREQIRQQRNKRAKIEHNLDNAYADLIFDIRLNLDRQLKDKLNSEMRRYETSADNAQSTVTESKRCLVKKASWWQFWADDEYGTHYWDVNTVNATLIRRTIRQICENLEDNLSYTAAEYTKKWKEQTYNRIIGALREAIGDADLDFAITARIVRNIIARIPEPDFHPDNSLPTELKKSGQIRDGEADAYMEVADNFVTNLSSRVREAISNFIGEWIANLENLDLVNALTGNLENELEQLKNEIDNREVSLYRYRTIQQELEQCNSTQPNK